MDASHPAAPARPAPAGGYGQRAFRRGPRTAGPEHTAAGRGERAGRLAAIRVHAGPEPLSKARRAVHQHPGIGVQGGDAGTGRPAAFSITRPRYITTTLSHRNSTVGRSWEMNSSARPSSSRKLRSKLITWAWTETSRAETGLVRKDQVRSRRQRAGDRDTLPLAAGEFVRISPSRRRRSDPPGSGARRPDPAARPGPRARAPTAVRSRSRPRACADRGWWRGPGTPPPPAAGKAASARPLRVRTSIPVEPHRTGAGALEPQDGAADRCSCRSRTRRPARRSRPGRPGSSRLRRRAPPPKAGRRRPLTLKRVVSRSRTRRGGRGVPRRGSSHAASSRTQRTARAGSPRMGRRSAGSRQGPAA